MDKAGDRAGDHGDERGTDKHMSEADAKEQTILIDAIVAERGTMKRIGNECVGEHGHALVQSIGGIFFYFDHRFDQAARLLESLEPLF